MSFLTKNNGKIMLGDSVYSVGKKVVQVFLPAVSTLYFALSGIWNLPSPEKVIGTIAALTTFLGVTLHISSVQFDTSGAKYDGTVHLSTTPQGSAIGFNIDPQDLVTKEAVTFKVVPAPSSPVSLDPDPTPQPPPRK